MSPKKNTPLRLIHRPTRGTPEEALAVAILLQAIDDWQRWGAEPKRLPSEYSQFLDEMGFTNPREELMAFFRSAWAKYLVEMCGWSYDHFLKCLNIQQE